MQCRLATTRAGARAQGNVQMDGYTARTRKKYQLALFTAVEWTGRPEDEPKLVTVPFAVTRITQSKIQATIGLAVAVH